MKIIYWSPWFIPQKDKNWNILFEEPKRLFTSIADEFKEKYKNDDRLISSLRCPAFSNLTKNIFFSENPMSTEFYVENGELKYVGENFYICSISKNKNTFTYGLPFIFFSEDNIEMEFTSPFFHKIEYTKYARLVPGRFNISKWFRPINLEMIINENYFIMKENETMCYFNFLTDDKVILKRFQMNETLRKISETCSTVSDWWKNVPILKRYDRFLKTKTNKIVIKEIKKQLVE
jgi:hypothetical protein